ncbi:MAG: hypothetical protein AB1689_04605 [Thermodesulfobacteriota bacterium]
MSLRDEQVELYSRQIILRELGGVGQRRLLAGRVLAIGGGAACEAALSYLAGAGIGALDRVAREAPRTDGSGGARLPLAPLATRSPDARVRLLGSSGGAAAPASLDGYDVVLSFDGRAGGEPYVLPPGTPRLGSVAVRMQDDGAPEVVLLPRGGGCLACLAGEVTRQDAPARAAAVAEIALSGTLAALACCRWLAGIGTSAEHGPRALRLAADGATWSEHVPERRTSCPRGCPPQAEPV